MKKITKREIISFILGIIITGGIGVFAYSMNAKQIAFTPSDNTWNVSNVSDAIDDLNEKSNKKLRLQYDFGTNHSSFTRFQNRILLQEYSDRYKYIKVISAPVLAGSCSNIYINNVSDQTSGNISVNTEYVLKNTFSSGSMVVTTSGSQGCFHKIILELYN